ncbi:MAG TPA: YlxR family protein [Methylomirabilota bacterium]|nr:YlxR family protein [Methylomirabilota bacterium]
MAGRPPGRRAAGARGGAGAVRAARGSPGGTRRVSAGRRGGRTAAAPVGPGPFRTCVGCRRVRPQVVLVRLARGPGGSVEADPPRRRGGRGAYLCPREECLQEALRRGRWTHLFRGAAHVLDETIERLRAEIGREQEKGLADDQRDGGNDSAARPKDRAGALAEGRW